MTEKMSIGIEGLDEVLCGGLLRGRSYLVKGVAGSGKTTLGLQFLLAGAERWGEAGLLFTFEEKADKLQEDAASLGLDLREAERRGEVMVVATSPSAIGDLLSNPGGRIGKFLAEHAAHRAVVDSLTAFTALAAEPTELRARVNQFLAGLDREGLTPLLIVEESGQVSASMFEYQVDGVIDLAFVSHGGRRRRRTIEVLKARGQPFLAGKHAVELGAGGIRVYPLAQPRGGSATQRARERACTGIAGLDQMLGGGLLAGSTCLVAGSSGTGKTTLALSFLAQGGKSGEPGMMVSLQESAADLVDEAGAIGLGAGFQKGLVQVLYRSPIDLCPEELAYAAKQVVSRDGIRRVAIDSLSDLIAAATDEDLLRDTLYDLVDAFARAGVTAMFTHEIGEMFGPVSVTQERLSGLMHATIFLRFVEMDGRIRRAVSVLKMRGSAHDTSIQEIRTTGQGLVVEKRFEGREGLMRGAAQRSGGSDEKRLEEIYDHVSRRQEALQRLKSAHRRTPE
ncbi:MAG: AAA family ATPase [Candidatus Schekmanbacteria bacterium]|nr:AAA family ATPase [Candidatus Schekmanbacteria bacterium]